MNHNSRYEQIQKRCLNALKQLDFLDFLSIDKFTVDDWKQVLKFGIGRVDCRRFGLKKLGGRKSRIDAIKQKLCRYRVFSQYWWDDCQEIEDRYARSTVMKALSQL